MFRWKRRPLLRGDSLTLLLAIKVYRFLFFSFAYYSPQSLTITNIFSYKRYYYYYYSVSRVRFLFFTSFNIITS